MTMLHSPGAARIIYRLLAVASMLCLSCEASFSQMIGDPKCRDQGHTSQRVEAIRANVVALQDSVEMVPPDEAAFIRSEAQKALDQSNSARYNAVVNRRYFRALQFHDDAQVALDNLEAAKNASGKDLARYLVVVLSRLGEVNERMIAFIDADSHRASPTLDKARRDEIYYRLPAAKAVVVSLLQCVISVL
ncbi:hypothetical protein QCM80_02525 [Bradyrhizobium sp. SSUT112]|uniref:hypothetical protein n=1 Tax=Bradyrhizobium sp. SSUT112 TaxID=3040604 RepID=UPI0024498BEC|nr:hypothetical protein [Bradyrhizobium sp. SSUT112]MDH2349559.1 hypothetical protein [Bradyrhizobium sp. SSUT112]